MARLFDRNMFIMLLSVMVGIIVITYFVADIQNRMAREELATQYSSEIETIESKNINFTNCLFQSLGLLDIAREYRAEGNYNFDLAMIWYSTILSETNFTKLQIYKNRTIGYCDDAITNYTYCYGNFVEAENRFEFTKPYTSYDVYLSILNLYVNLTKSGGRLALLRINASLYLKYIVENITITENDVSFGNTSGLLALFNETMALYQGELEIYDDIEDQIDKEYDIIGFSEIREEG